MQEPVSAAPRSAGDRVARALELLIEARTLLLEGETRRAVELAAEAVALALDELKGGGCSGSRESAESLARLLLGQSEPAAWEAERILDEAGDLVALAARKRQRSG